MDYQMLAIVLLFVGLALMIAEFFIPSGGMISVFCLICLVTSVWAAYKAWWGTSYFWIYVASLLLIVPTALFALIKVLESTSLGNRMLLTAPDQQEVTPYQAEQARLQAFVGRTAKTVTQFNPGGILMIEGERVHAFSEGLLIPAGETVEVTEVRGNRLVVRPQFAQPERLDLPVSQTSMSSSNSLEQPPAEAEPPLLDPFSDVPPLDFDLPAR